MAHVPFEERRSAYEPNGEVSSDCDPNSCKGMAEISESDFRSVFALLHIVKLAEFLSSFVLLMIVGHSLSHTRFSSKSQAYQQS